jgi:acyl carrier protein
MYRSGYLVRWLPNGEIDFLGRVDHQIKLRGMRVEPGEIEAVLNRHPEVREAVVLALDDGNGGKRLVAYAAPPAPEPHVRDYLKSQLPEYMVPSAFVWLAALPLTPNNKVDRRALAALEVAPEGGREFVPPETAIERLVASIWSEILGVEKVGRNDDFWALGGHSLLATRVLSRIDAALHVEVPLRTLFQSPTVADLAHAIGEILFADDGEPFDEDDE